MVKVKICVDDQLLERFRKIAAARYNGEDFLGKAITESMRQRIEEIERRKAINPFMRS